MDKQKKTNIAIQQLGILINQENDYDQYEVGDLVCEILTYPTKEEAEVHRSANRLGNFDMLSEHQRLIQLLNSKNTDELKLCGCCGNIVNQQSIDFLTPLPQIKLGIGVRLYFTTLFYHILIFSIAFLLYSLYAMITNIKASREALGILCPKNQDCSNADIGLGAKLYYNQTFQSALAVQSVLGFALILIWSTIMIKKYYEDGKLEQQLKRDWLSASQFTLMLVDYPLAMINPKSNEETLLNIRKQFKEYETQVKSRVSFEVVKMSIGYPLFKWDEQNKEKLFKSEKYIQKKRKIFIDLLKERQLSQVFTLTEEQRNQLYEEFYQLITNHDYEKRNHLQELDQKNIVFVTLRYSKARELIESMNEDKLSFVKKCVKEENEKNLFPVKGVTIQKAPEPDEIKWENIGFSKSLKLCRKVTIYALALLLIGISLAISISLGSLQTQDLQVQISMVISIVITIINFLIELLIILLSYFQRQFIKSQEEASIGIKIAVSQIINCIGVPITLEFLGKATIFTQGGIVTNVFFISLINMILPIGRFIDPFNIVLKIIEKYFDNAERRLIRLKGQIQLNKIYTFYEFELGYEYAYIIKTCYFTAFFLPLQPIIALFAPVGLFLMFLCNKYRLLNRFNKPNFHSGSVNTMLSFILKCSMIGLSMGQLYFMNFQQYRLHFNLIINWVSLGITVLFVFFPLSSCDRLFQKQTLSGMDYNEKLLYLTTDYDRLNPITKEDAIKDFMEYLKQQEERHLPVPEQSLMIQRSLIEINKNASSMINFIREKTKAYLPAEPMYRSSHAQNNLGAELKTSDRFL